MMSNYCLSFFSPIKKLQPSDYCPKPLASKIHVTYRSTKVLTADVLEYKEEFLKRHATNTKSHWSFINRLTKLGESKQKEIYFFILSKNWFNLVAQPCHMHIWKHSG